MHRSAPLSSARDSKCEQGQREAATDNEALNEQTGCSQRQTRKTTHHEPKQNRSLDEGQTEDPVPNIHKTRNTSRLGDNGRQMNPSTQRSIQAGRQKGDKGRQMNPSTQRGIQAGRQRQTNKGRQRETNQSVHPQRWETNEGEPRETSESVRLGSRDRHPGWETRGDK